MAELGNKRRQLTLSEKLAFIEKIDSGKNLSALAREFGIPRSTARGIVVNKSRFKLLHDHHKVALHRKRMRFSCYSDIEEAVYMWFRQMRSKNNPVNGPMLQQKAREFAKKFGHQNFEGSSGWLCRFRERHDMSVEAMSGDTGESDVTSIGMTDEEIVSCINHNASLQSGKRSVVAVSGDTGESDVTSVGMTDEEIVSSMNHEASLQSEYIVSDVDVKFFEPDDTNISSLSNSTYPKELSTNDGPSSRDKNDLYLCDYSGKELTNNDGQSSVQSNLCDCSSIGRYTNRTDDPTSFSKLSDAIALVKRLNSFFEQQKDNTPQIIWNCLSDINSYMLGDLSKQIKQRRITDYFNRCKCKAK